MRPIRLDAPAASTIPAILSDSAPDIAVYRLAALAQGALGDRYLIEKPRQVADSEYSPSQTKLGATEGLGGAVPTKDTSPIPGEP